MNEKGHGPFVKGSVDVSTEGMKEVRRPFPEVKSPRRDR